MLDAELAAAGELLSSLWHLKTDGNNSLLFTQRLVTSLEDAPADCKNGRQMGSKTSFHALSPEFPARECVQRTL